MALGLLHQVFAGARIGEVQAILVDEHRLLLEPLLPGFLGDVLPDPLAELAGIRREIEALGLAAELDALHHPSHEAIIRGARGGSPLPICASKRPSNRAASCRAPGVVTAAPLPRQGGSPARETSAPHASSARRACAA